MKIGQTLAGGTLLAMVVLTAYEAHQDRARMDAMGQAIAQMRDDVSSRENTDHGEGLRALLAASQAAQAQPTSAATIIPGGAKEAPRSKEAEHPPLQPAQMREHIDGSFSTERIDAAWAGGAQNLAHERLRGALSEGSEVRSLECRASLCRIETSHADRGHYVAFVRMAFMDPSTQLWNAGTFSMPLDDASQAEGPFVAVTYVAREGQSLPQMPE